MSIIISSIALIISLLTFWLTRIQKGKVRMTRPSIIFFGPDGRNNSHNKIFIRTLLYSTSERGQYIQNMHIRLWKGENVQNFNIWVYDNNGLVRGSGLFINKNGVSFNHHFLLPKDGIYYAFQPGDYTLEVFVEIVGKKPQLIFTQKLNLTEAQSSEMINKKIGVYFDWAPNSQNYYSHLDYSK